MKIIRTTVPGQYALHRALLAERDTAALPLDGEATDKLARELYCVIWNEAIDWAKAHPDLVATDNGYCMTDGEEGDNAQAQGDAGTGVDGDGPVPDPGTERAGGPGVRSAVAGEPRPDDGPGNAGPAAG